MRERGSSVAAVGFRTCRAFYGNSGFVLAADLDGVRVWAWRAGDVSGGDLDAGHGSGHGEANEGASGTCGLALGFLGVLKPDSRCGRLLPTLPTSP